jgi:hypothetical protein
LVHDHDALRHDPVLGLLSGKLEARRSDCAVLAGKSTLNRLEHAPRSDDDRYRKLSVDEEALKRLFVSLFLESRAAPPKRIILDLDATDDPIHGGQEGRFFHGYYQCYCYLPLYGMMDDVFWPALPDPEKLVLQAPGCGQGGASAERPKSRVS